jgi:hypothetical protein
MISSRCFVVGLDRGLRSFGKKQTLSKGVSAAQGECMDSDWCVLLPFQRVRYLNAAGVLVAADQSHLQLRKQLAFERTFRARTMHGHHTAMAIFTPVRTCAVQQT